MGCNKMVEPSPLDVELPEYRSPPIVEVAASIQFANIRGLDTAKLGLLWSRFRNEFPLTEQHPPLPVASETFGTSRSGRVGFTVETSFPNPRLWFLNTDGTRLLQFQSNRLVVNWRQSNTSQPYLRYTGLKALLIDTLTVFGQFLSDEGLGPIAPDQSELTYVNHIAAGEPGDQRKPLSTFVRCWKDELDMQGLESVEETSFRSQYVVRREGPPGRLFVELDSAYTNVDRTPIYVLTIVAKGAPNSPDVNGALGFLDDAHRWVVNSFTHLTTVEAHNLWERSK